MQQVTTVCHSEVELYPADRCFIPSGLSGTAANISEYSLISRYISAHEVVLDG